VRGRRWPIFLIGAVLALSTGPGAAMAQKPATKHAKPKPALGLVTGSGSCVSVVRLRGCASARGFSSPDELDAALSPDGRSLYVASTTSPSIGILSANQRTGAIKQPGGSSGCLLERGGDSDKTVTGCGRARGFGVGTYGVAVSPDGRSVYVVSDNRDDPGDPPAASIAVFSRRSNGALKQLAGAAGCLASSPGDGCTVVPGLSGLKVAVSPDGARVYVTGPNLWVLSRHAATGALTVAGCETMVASQGCEVTPFARALSQPVWGPDGHHAYVLTSDAPPHAANYLDALVSLAVEPTRALPTPLPVDGCLAAGVPGCTADNRLGPDLSDPAVSPDGRNLYTAGIADIYDQPPHRGTPFQLTAYRIDAAGSLTRTGGSCLSTTHRRGCNLQRNILGIQTVSVSADGKRLYATADDAVLAFSRRSSTGRLHMLMRIDACEKPKDCPHPRTTLIGIQQLIPSPDGQWVYAISANSPDGGTVSVLAAH
jgi:DNA-binding beta-propeller fold protein YncE